MKLHPTGIDPTTDAKLVCRNARFGLLILLAMFWGLAAVWWWVDVRWVAYIFAVLALFLTPLLIGAWRKRGRADNWVLVLHDDGLWVNLRDCEYYRADSGETVLFLPYAEITAARKTVLRYTTPDSDGGNTSHKNVFLDLQVAVDDPELLHDALRAELCRSPKPRKCLGGIVEVGSGKINRLPVEFLGDDLLRIKFYYASNSPPVTMAYYPGRNACSQFSAIMFL